MPRIEACDGEPATAQLVHQPWRHRTGLDTDAGILAAMPPHRALNLFRIGSALATPQSATGVVHDTDRGRFLRYVQANIVGHRTASDGESDRATARSAALSASQPAAAITRCPHMNSATLRRRCVHQIQMSPVLPF